MRMCKWTTERVNMSGRPLQRLNVMFANKERDDFVKSGTYAVPRSGRLSIINTVVSHNKHSNSFLDLF